MTITSVNVTGPTPVSAAVTSTTAVSLQAHVAGTGFNGGKVDLEIALDGTNYSQAIRITEPSIHQVAIPVGAKYQATGTVNGMNVVITVL